MHLIPLSLLILLMVVVAESTIMGGQCMEFVPILLPNGKSISGNKNVGRCTCEKAREKEMAQQIPDKWVPSCESDGKWMKKQQDWIGAWCVDANGNQISEKALRDERRNLKCE
ncbi:U24-ctenitoxin-Pn1a-like [Paramacrobiotus metropolitanus]|uniref:U24-ctenitoxin-Pn1a-like n=1 Tax=Paramacrobiotus metropolitanus TaxID=2943436 RepID=UPI00244640D7|nr:U24-ctenitoxin-Pn1a-like [Paramacrobiotus metropolitanus]